MTRQFSWKLVCQGSSINSHGNPSDGSRMAKFRRWWPPHGPKIKVHVLVQINVLRRQSHVCVHYYRAPPWIRRKDDKIIRLHHLQLSFSWIDATRSAWWWWCLLLGGRGGHTSADHLNRATTQWTPIMNTFFLIDFLGAIEAPRTSSSREGPVIKQEARRHTPSWRQYHHHHHHSGPPSLFLKAV